MSHEYDPFGASAGGRRDEEPPEEETAQTSEESEDWEPRRRKERILHTRISEDLAEDLRRVAEDLRVPVSNLVRNVLEEAFSVVETVTGNVGELIEEVMDEAEAVRERIRSRQHRRHHGRHRRHRRRHGRSFEQPERETGGSAPPEAGAPFADAAAAPDEADVIGWQALLLARPQRCARCGTLLGRGEPAYASVTARGTGERWSCEGCLRG